MNHDLDKIRRHLPTPEAIEADRQRRTIAEAMCLLGSRTSKAKAAAARANGRKGGRPKRLADAIVTGLHTDSGTPKQKAKA